MSKPAKIILLIVATLSLATCTAEEKDRPLRFTPPPADQAPEQEGQGPNRRKPNGDRITAQAAHPIMVERERTVSADQLIEKLRCRPGLLTEKTPVGRAKATKIQIKTPHLAVTRFRPDKQNETVRLSYQERECNYATETIDRLYVADRSGLALRKSFARGRVTIRLYELGRSCQPHAKVVFAANQKAEIRRFEKQLSRLPECTSR